MSTSVSPLGPIDPNSVPEAETEKTAPWIVRKLVGSMTGRIVRSSWETLKASGTNIVCLSPWGDSSPLLLPCIRFRDLAVHTIIAATGGVAAVAAPVMGPVSDVVVSTFGDTILVEMGVHVGFDLSAKAANDLILDGAIHKIVPIHSSRLQTTGVKVMTITLKYKHIPEDASLGFYRSGIHKDNSLFSSVMDYLSIEKGWFSPYLFASGRKPAIPRSVKPDIVFCHGPFLSGDYKLGETLLAESAQVISFAKAPPPPPPAPASPTSSEHPPSPSPSSHSHSLSHSLSKSLHLPSLSQTFARSRTPSPEPQPALAPLPAPPQPRRIVVVVIGLKPHRAGLWTSSQRPSESVIQYGLLNGCPAVVVPAKLGAPLLAWDTLTLEQLWKVELPAEGEGAKSKDGRFEGIVGVLFEYLDLCVDWERVVLAGKDEQLQAAGAGDAAHVVDADGKADEEKKREAVKDAVEVLVAAAVRGGASKAVKDDVDRERAGIAMWRIP